MADGALQECDTILHGEGLIGTSIGGVTELGHRTVMAYYPWWYIEDYHRRGSIRGDVWTVLWRHMQKAGIKLEIKPFDNQDLDDGPMDMNLLAGESES